MNPNDSSRPNGEHDALRLTFAAGLHRLISELQRTFIAEGAASREWWKAALDGLLALTGSEYGFIGSTGEDREGLYLRTEAITNIAWDEPTRRLYEENQAKGMVFRNLNTLFGRVLAERRTLVSNDVEHDPRAGGRPHGHPPLRAFAGLACGDEMVAMIGLANREGGYSESLIEDLKPATVFVESIVRQAKSAAERRLAEARLHAIARATLDTIITIDQKGTILDVNPAIEHAFGYTPSECLGQNVSMLMGAPEREAHDGYLAHYLKTGEKRIIGLPREVAAYRKDGSQVLVELFVSEIMLDGQRCYAGVLRDVTARAQTERRLRDSAAQLSTALEMAKAGHWEYDVVADRFTFNDAFYKIFGATADALGGYHLTPSEYATRFVHPDERAVVGEEVAAALSSNEPHYTRDLQHRFLYFDGRVGQLAVRLTVARDDRGAITKLYGVNQDITERVLQEQTRARVEEQERMNRELAARVEELDRNQNVSALTSECVELLQRCVTLEEGIEVVSRFIDRMYPEANVRIYVQESSLDELRLHRTFERFGGESPRLVIETPDCWGLRLRRVYVAEPGGAHLTCEHLSHHQGGTTLCAPLVSLDRLAALVSVSMPRPLGDPAFERRRAERLAAQFETTAQSLGGALSTISLRESLQRLALVDELTGLPNRRAFYASAKRAMARSQRSGRSLAVAIFDLDHFKRVNDTWGHDEGDRVLQQVAKVTAGFFRTEDLSGRLGGEEFGVLLSDIEHADAEARLDRFREEVSATVRAKREQVSISVGFAMAHPSTKALDFDQLLRDADVALYEAKRRGRNNVVCFDETHAPATMAEPRLAEGLDASFGGTSTKPPPDA